MTDNRDITQSTVWECLVRGNRVGRASGLTAEALAQAITGRNVPSERRRLRSCVEELRKRGYPVCAHPSAGYYIAANAQDVDDTCEYLYQRLLTSLRQISALKRVAIPELRGQLGLPLHMPSGEEPPNGQ
ncbi:MAG: hypothetical protein Q8L45_01600 [Xanthomonadaceae bacterium]|nr:hypothetical protein [Xanthomonadaceae bacterium]MDP2185045.1 hypothetical protein [Xanthomonadales bacterium]MDZ4114424.1 hypothetical protein [Xanthomonadaceae bacterium]